MTKKFFRKIYSILPSPAEKLCLKYENGIIYIFYGVLTTLVNYTVHFGLRLAFADLPPQDALTFQSLIDSMANSAVSSAGAATVSWIVSVIFAFYVNKIFVFEKKSTVKGETLREFLTFSGGRIFSYGCELAIMFTFVDMLHFNELIVKLMCGIVVMILNYFLSKFLVFTKNNKENSR